MFCIRKAQFGVPGEAKPSFDFNADQPVSESYCNHARMSAESVGRQARKGKFPWQLILKNSRSDMCDAVLISPNYALTAATCVSYRKDPSYP